MDITIGIRAWYWNLMVLKMIQMNNPPPLEPKFEGVFVEEEEVEEEEVHFVEIMTNEGKGLPDDKDKYIKLMKPLFDEINKNLTQHLMKGFKLMVANLEAKE